ncbi:MAG: SusC/RagA family TonB-linked outer membrane protein [Niastella sp.]|uniref:SusC/RagA family TonB-linked outer membrane protein n=1 Tax=Niastella sp. TaxID=1869183 RepID=UPI00389B212F
MGLHTFKRATIFLWLLVIPFLVQAQRSITGKVVSAKDNAPVSGASVQIKGSGTGTSSNEAGAFTIQVKEGDMLVISGVGFDTRQIKIAGEDNLTISLSESAKDLNEVVVTALGVKKETKKLGYAVQEVKGDILVKARDQNPITGLTGKVAGLSVGASAELLRKPTVLLRGNEINLYVVDGIPISTDTWNISPDDIETYTVLKGPAAAALYGSRAQYGAILITMKKGTKAKKGFAVEFNSTNSIDKGFLAFPRVQDEYGPGENALYAFGNGKGGGKNDNDYDVWGPRFEGQLIPQYDGAYDPAQTYVTTFPGGHDQDYSGHIKPTPWIARGVNNLGRFLRTGFQSTNNVALSASGENYNMRFSMSHSYQQSIIPNMGLNITNFNVYAGVNVNPRLKIEANVNYNRQYTPNFPDVDYGPNSLIYNVGIWTGADWDVESPDLKAIWNPSKIGIQSVFAEYQRYHNPRFMVKEWLRGHYKNDLFGYVSANFKINNNLNVTARTQATTYGLLRTERMPFSAHPYGREGGLGDYREDHRNLFENNIELLLAYNYNVHKFLNLSGLVGGNVRSFTYNSTFTSTDYMTVPGVYTFSNTLNPVQGSSFSSDMRVYSAYYSLDAAFDKYATLSVTGRLDKSSALPKAHNSYFYPAVSAASVISDYVTLPRVISFLKARGSFAVVHGDATSPTVGMAPFNSISAFGASPSGNSLFDYPLNYGNNYQSPYGGPDYSLAAVYSMNKPYNNQSAASYTNNLYDPNIKTFNRVNYEEGFDIKLLQNRVGLSATAFQYVDGPRILANPISTASGYGYYYLNALTTQKSGYELSLNGSPLKMHNGLFWDVTVNWSTFQDKYKELPPGQTTYQTFFKNGDRVDKLYTSAFAKTTDGKIIHDNAGKPLQNPVPQFLGYLNADYQWSIYNKVGYKGFTLGFQFDGSVGGVTTDYIHNKTMRGGRNIETVQGALGVARKADNDHAGDKTFPGVYVGDGVVVSNGKPINFDNNGAIINYKDLQFGDNKTTTHVQDYVSKFYGVDESNLMSKTFAKLREVTLTYDLPTALLKKSFIDRASISLIGRNLIYFYKDKRFKDVDLDQYNYATGASGLQSPTTRRYGVNLNLAF